MIYKYIDGIPLFSTKGKALKWGYQYGLEGFHTHRHGNRIGYMGGKTHAEINAVVNQNTIPQSVQVTYNQNQSQSINTTPITTPTTPATSATTTGGGGGGGGY
jgi:hypothetical protein